MKESVLLAASAFVSVVVNALGAARRRSSPRRILVVKLDHLGDVITATPALRALRDAHPGAVLDLLLSPGVAPLFAGTPLADRVLTYGSPRFRRGASPGARRPDERGRGSEELRNAIAGLRYDTVVELRGDPATLRLPFQVGAIRRLDRGGVRVRDWTRRRVDRARGRARAPLHEVETNLAVIRPLLPHSARRQAPRPEIHVPPGARERVRETLITAGIRPDRAIVVIHPGAGWRPRAWRPERFAAIAAWIQEHYDAQVVFVGSAEEGDLERALGSALGPDTGAVLLFGKLSLPEIAALIASSRMFLGNDSGLAHVASAVGTPAVALFGAQDPARFRPWSERTIVLHHPVPCFPCRQIRCVRPEMPCVNLIETSEVQAAVNGILGASRHP